MREHLYRRPKHYWMGCIHDLEYVMSRTVSYNQKDLQLITRMEKKKKDVPTAMIHAYGDESNFNSLNI